MLTQLQISVHLLGIIDEARIWNTAKSQSDIQSNMNNELCTIPTDLVLYHKFNNGIADADNTGIIDAMDETGNGNNGILTDFSLNGSTSNWVLGSGINPPCEGCTDPSACNYDSSATTDDGSCEYTSCLGCTDATACNYDPSATSDDGSCDYTACDMNAIHFDGNDDVVSTAYNGVLGTANRTFEAWVYVDADAPTSNLCILDYGTNAVGSRNTFMVNGSRALNFTSGGTNANISSSANDVPVGAWTHVAFVLNAGTGYLYVNGVEVGSGSLTSVNTPSSETVTIGQRVMGGSIPFDGIIDEVRIWSVARTQAEIQGFMNSELCDTSGDLMMYHKFNHGVADGDNASVTTALDSSVNGYDGTLSGFNLNGTTSNWVLGTTLSTSCEGCTDPSACNYDPVVTIDDGSCDLSSCIGCTDPTACNYDFSATIDDGSCNLPDGCIDSNACNYDPTASCDDGSCIYSTINTCAGDANFDGVVNILDLLAVSANFGYICD